MPSEALNNIARLIDREVKEGNIKDMGGQIDRTRAHELQLKLLQLMFLERIATHMETIAGFVEGGKLVQEPIPHTPLPSQQKKTKEREKPKPVKEEEALDELEGIPIADEL